MGDVGVNSQEENRQRTVANEANRSSFIIKARRLLRKGVSHIQNSKSLLAVLCICSAAQSMALNGLIPNSITNIEKRFQLNSGQSGLFSSMYDIAVLVALIPVCHYGEKGNKGHWIGAGMLLLGLGSLTCTLPHFISRPYKYSSGRTYKFCATGEESAPSSFLFSENYESFALPLLLFGQFLHGVGAAPLYTLGVSYLDENVSQKMSPIYLGLFFASGTLGPAFGYLAGGLFLSVYGDVDKVDVSRIDIEPDDPSWYGAWWIGFLITGVVAILMCPLLCAFDKELPEAKEHATTRVDQQGLGSTSNAVQMNGKLKDLPGLVTTLMKNLTYVFLVCKDTLSSFLLNGFITFMPKFMQTVFSMTAGASSIITGCIVVPAGVAGNIIGGYIMKWYKLRCRKTILFCIIVELIGILFTLSFLIDCSRTLMAGPDVQYNTTGNGRSVLQQCNADCKCDFVYNPACDESTKVTYFSPCYAACKAEIVNATDSKEVIWTNCTCLVGHPIIDAGTASTRSSELVSGACSTTCVSMYIFFVCFTLIVFLTFLSAIPSQQAVLRCVLFDYRTLALGVNYVFARALGSVPGPIVFGLIIDKTCTVWAGDTDQASCLWYSDYDFRMITFIFGICLKLLSAIALTAAWKFYRSLEPETKHSTLTGDAIGWFGTKRHRASLIVFDRDNVVLSNYCRNSSEG